VSEEEILALLQFGIVAVVLVPLLPASAHGPYGAVVPRQVGYVVVVLTGVSLAGYLLVRLLGGSVGWALAGLVFQFARYLLMSSSRPGTQPANLQGIWNKDMNPMWDSKYTTNINTEMNYWPAEVTNLSECHGPLFDFTDMVRAGISLPALMKLMGHADIQLRCNMCKSLRKMFTCSMRALWRSWFGPFRGSLHEPRPTSSHPTSAGSPL
jgi:hypothetical protein